MTNANPCKQAKSKQIQFKNDQDTTCGFRCWHPAWLQYFANAKFFAINFSIVGILQGALFTYMVGIMSTLEKRYAFESKVSGFILIADNLSGMVASPIVGYLGSKYNRSTIIGVGEFIVALSAIMNVIPYYIYGPGTHLLADEHMFSKSNTTHFELCLANQSENCATGSNSTVLVAVVILWLSSFANGLGYTAFYTVGLPLIDDSIAKKNSAMYLSYVATLRFLGPTLGFILSSFCLSFYENPFIVPEISKNDPRWIGAWWLGFIILGLLIIIFSIPMLMFPLKFKNKNEAKNETTKSVSNEEQFDGAWNSIKRLSTNYLLMFHIWGSIFRLIGYLGYYIVKPKYIELQYRQSASSASLYTGATSVVTMAIGTMAGGIFIRYAKPKPRYLAILVVLMELFSTIGIFSSMFFNCPTPQFAMLPDTPGTCNSDCQCSTKVYQPICGVDGVTNYFSPCYAGCKNYEKGRSQFSNCSCMSESNMLHNWASNGHCKKDCNKFPLYIAVLSICNFFASTTRTGDTLITLRSVEPRDKSFAFGVMGTMFSIFAFTPYPLIFGAITDSACLVWEKTCGKTGNCWVYDIDKLRIYLHTGSLIFILIGVALEIGTIVFANRIQNLYEDEEIKFDEMNPNVDLNKNETNGTNDADKAIEMQNCDSLQKIDKNA